MGAAGGRLLDRVGGRPVQGATRRVGLVTWYGRIIGRHQLDTDHYGDVDWLTGSNMAFRRELIGHGLFAAQILAGAANVISRLKPWAVVTHDTTSRRDPVLASRVFGSDVFKSAANHTYALLKYLPATRRTAFTVYAYLVGQASLPGPGRALLELVRSPLRSRAMFGRIGMVWRGRREGARMWRLAGSHVTLREPASSATR